MYRMIILLLLYGQYVDIPTSHYIFMFSVAALPSFKTKFSHWRQIKKPEPDLHLKDGHYMFLV